MKSLSLSLIAVSLTAARPAVADTKAKAAVPPVPTYWLGELDTDLRPDGAPQPGTVKVADGAAPKDAILVQPLDPDRFATPATAQTSAAGSQLAYTASYLVPYSRINEAPRVIVVEASAKPALIKNKRVETAIRKLAVKAKVSPFPTRWQIGLADLDGDTTADVALA